ncbi:MAG: WGR domain-containing protein [Planctomycetaceae bacterium]
MAKKAASSDSASTARMFEFHEGTSDKFWEITLSGTSHTVRYGRIGTDGQSGTKDFGTEAKALADYEKLIKQKTGKGYAEVTGQSDSRAVRIQTSRATAKEREPFIKSILETPDDPAPYLVYADWLEDNGDARGELIRIQWQLEDESIKAVERKKLQTREQALLKAHQADWLEDLSDDLINQKGPEDLLWGNEKKFYRWEFARGLLDSLHVTYLLPEFSALLRKSPAAATLRRLVIRDPSNAYSLEDIEAYADKEWDEDDAPALKMLNGTKFGNMRHFEVSEEEAFNCHCSAPSVHNLVKQMPRLETLHLDAHELNIQAIFRLQLPELRSLKLQHTARRYPLEVLAKNESMGKLESLYLWPHALDYDDEDDGAYINLEGFRALCRSKNLPSLKHVHLFLTDFGDQGVTELVNSELLPRLKSLSLANGAISDEGARLLSEADLSGLEELDVSGNYLTRTGVALIKKAFPKVKAGEQHTGNPADEREHLFHGDIE